MSAPLPVANPSPGLVILESAVFLLGVAILGAALFWWGRRIFGENDPP